MRTADNVLLAAQGLRRYPLRTAMLLTAIAIGVAAVVMLTAVGEGARRYVIGQFTALGTQLLIVLPGRSGTTGTGGAGMLIGETARDLTLGDAMALKRSPRVTHIAPLVVGSGTASVGSREREVTVLGATADMLPIQRWSLSSGRFLPAIDMDVASPVCVLGSTVRDELFRGEPLGEWLRLGDTRCRVIGVLNSLGVGHGFDADDMVILPVASAQQLFNSPSVFRILVEVTAREAVPRAKEDVIRIIKERHQDEEDVTVISQDAVASTFDSILRMVTWALAGIAGISLLVAGVLTMNVMLVAVTQRTSEIGLLKALGARRGQIMRLFLTEAAFLSLAGALAGIGIGLVGAWVLRVLFPSLDFVPPPWSVALAVGVAIASGLVFGILPARRAAELDPVIALAGHR
jgi:putative ABC transport system permease protein